MTLTLDQPPFGLTVPGDLFSEDAERVVLEYARRLSAWVGADHFPRSMSAIAEKLKHRVRSAPLPTGVRGMRLSRPKRLIVTSEDETRAAQERTIAHEILHQFIGIRHYQYVSSKGRPTRLQARVENLCEIGAAELHVPADEMERLVGGRAAIRDIPRFAEYFGASLAATLRSMVAVAPLPLASIVFEHKHKPTDRVPSITGQQVLWGTPSDFDAPRRLRVQDWSVTRGERIRFNYHQHVNESTSIYAAFSSGAPTSGWDDLVSIGLLDGSYRTESWPHGYKHTTRVLTLIWLDRSLAFTAGSRSHQLLSVV